MNTCILIIIAIIGCIAITLIVIYYYKFLRKDKRILHTLVGSLPSEMLFGWHYKIQLRKNDVYVNSPTLHIDIHSDKAVLYLKFYDGNKSDFVDLKLKDLQKTVAIDFEIWQQIVRVRLKGGSDE